jgi:peptidoglycan/LPS O-acetylase OafA/YrhL
MALLIYGIRPESADSYVPYLFFIQNLAWTHPPFFGEAWSLAVEEAFYLLVPITLSTISFLSRSKKIGLILTTGLFFTTSLVIKLIYVEIYNPTFDDGVRKIVVLRLDALMIGVFLAWIASSVKNKTISNLGIFLLPLFFVQPIFYLITETSFDHSHFARTWLFPITSLGCAGLIMVGIYSIQPPKLIIALNSRIARLSYSAYLVNLPVLAVIEYIFKDGQMAGYLKWIIYICSTFFLSAITYRVIEVPFLRYRDRVISSGSLKIGALGVSPK